MFRFAAIALIACAAVSAQGISITAEAGVGGVVIPPATELRVTITKADPRPFVGRLHVVLGNKDFMQAGRRGRGMGFPADVAVTQDISLEEGAMQRVVRLEVPVANAVAAVITLERQISGDYYEPVAAADVQAPARNDAGKIVGFVSDARLSLARPFMFFELVEIPVAELPESWKGLAGFDAIILNDDRLTRAQSAALIDYVSMGGTLIISPHGPASFNPETPAGRLLKIPATTTPKRVSLGDYPELLAVPRMASGEARGAQPPVNGAEAPPGEPTVPRAADAVLPSTADQQFLFWPDAGRATPVPDALGLASSAPVGAGTVVLLHLNLSEYPFIRNVAITHATVNVLTLSLKGVGDRLGRSPYAATMTNNVRQSIDIAGRRIPGREAMTLLLLIYVSIAGIGMFLLARRLRRPELYPAALLLAALLSVGLVFTFGEVYKRGGDRARVVRVVVSDDTTGRSGVFTFGCSYFVDGDNLRFVQGRDSMFVPVVPESRVARPGGTPDMVLDYNTHLTATDAQISVNTLDRWQNVFYTHRHPAAPEDLKLRVDSLEGAYRVTNLSGHKLHGVMFLVGKADPMERCDWHYQSLLAAAGGDDATATFSQSTLMEREITELENALRADLPDERTFDVFTEALNIHPAQRLTRHLNLGQLEGSLWNAGLLPAEGQYVMICVLPADALPPESLGAQDVEADAINQLNVWVVRGNLKSR